MANFVCSNCHNIRRGPGTFFLFGELISLASKNISLLRIKSFFRSPLYQKDDFREELFKAQKKFGLFPVGEIDVDLKNVDLEKSHLTFKISLAKTETNDWVPMYHEEDWDKHKRHLVQIMPISRVMNLHGCLQCSFPKFYGHLFVYMEAQGIISDFQGIFEVDAEINLSRSKALSEANVLAQTFFIVQSIAGQMEKQLLQIAEKLKDKKEVLELGLNLNLEYDIIETIITNNPNSITTAAHKMLRTWCSTTQGNVDDAHHNLGEALIKSKLTMIASEVLDYPTRYIEDGYRAKVPLYEEVSSKASAKETSQSKGYGHITKDHTEPELRTPRFLKELAAGIIGNIDIDDQWGPCPMTMMMNHKRYIGTVCHGKARKLQAPGSDVSFEIPDGYTGVYFMAVNTDVSKFKDVVKDKECFVSPVVQIEHLTQKYDMEHRSFTIRIPHCLKDPSQLKNIRVRHGHSLYPESFTLLQLLMSTGGFESNNDGYCVDKNYITIFAKTCSDFVCTSCRNTCKGTIKLFLLGKLKAWREKNVTTVQMKSFLCSPLFQISEFRQHLFNVQKTYRLFPVEESDVEIESTNFNLQQSDVTLKMSPAPKEGNNWGPICTENTWYTGNGSFSKRVPLSKIMELEGCHRCRTLDPREAMVIDIVADGICSEFHGLFDLVLHPLRTDSSEKESDLKTQIFFAIESGESLEARNTSPSRKFSNQIDDGNQRKTRLNREEITEQRCLSFNSTLHGNPSTKILTERQIVQIADRLTERPEIFRLGLNLNLEIHAMSTFFSNHPNSITSVADEMLCTWFGRQDNRSDAYTTLGEALVKSKLNMVAREILDYPPRPDENGRDRTRPGRSCNCSLS